jgi:hypothetical protein
MNEIVLHTHTSRGSGEIKYYLDYCIFETQIEKPKRIIKFPYTDFNNNKVDFYKFKELQSLDESSWFLIQNWKNILEHGEELNK